MGPLGLGEVLMPLGILRENLAPGRCNEDAATIAESPGRLFHVSRNGKLHQPQIPDRVGNAAVAEHRAGLSLRHAVRAHVPGQHLLGECERIAPRQRRATDRGLILDDAAARLMRAGKTGGFERVDQGGLAGPGSAGDDDEAVAVHGC